MRASWGPLAVLSSLLAACSHLPTLTAHHDPLSAEEHDKLGASYEAQGLSKEARGQYEAALRKAPADLKAWLALGNLSFAQGDFKRAEAAYRRILRSSPHHAGASNNLAMVYLTQARRLADAEALAQDALRQEGPLKPYVLDTLANIHVRQGRFSEARASLQLAEAAAPLEDAPLQEQLRRTRRSVEAERASP